MNKLNDKLKTLFTDLLEKEVNTEEEALIELAEFIHQNGVSKQEQVELLISEDIRVLTEMAVVLKGLETPKVMTQEVIMEFKDFTIPIAENTSADVHLVKGQKEFLKPRDNREHLQLLNDLTTSMEARGIEYNVILNGLAIFLHGKKHFEFMRVYFDHQHKQVSGDLIFNIVPNKGALDFLPEWFTNGRVVGERPSLNVSYVSPVMLTDVIKLLQQIDYDITEQVYKVAGS